MSRVLLALALVAEPLSAQPSGGLPFDPRHQFDARCPPAVVLDPAGQQRDPSSSSSYLWTALSPGATPADCAALCCHDWSCESFGFFANGSGCNSTGRPCCVFKDDVDRLVPAGPTDSVVTGVRAKLPAVPPPYPNSSLVSASLSPHFVVAINGDEFPITLAADGAHYTGAGDNHQPGGQSSPLSFFKVEGGPTELNCTDPATHGDQPAPACSGIQEQGVPVPVTDSAAAKACPQWRSGIPNLKSSGVLSVHGVLYWAISCFNYGDDPVFNRQRYGPAWIITSTDGGISWNHSATPTDFFTGRLAAPRFIQYGADYAGAPDEWVYVYFPGTADGSAFFENNDQMLLGRVPKQRILDRSAYQFFDGERLDGSVGWTSDETISQPVWSFPLMTSVQQANYHPGLGRFVFANWAWISYDGYARPDHTADQRNDRTGHQRTQLSLVEAAQPWGPFNVIHREDDWSGWDGSSGGYTPVFPVGLPAEAGAEGGGRRAGSGRTICGWCLPSAAATRGRRSTTTTSTRST